VAITLRSDKNRQRSLGILGRVAMAAEQDELLAELTLGGKGDSLELDFYDANTLSAPLIAALAQCLERGMNLRIVTYHCLLGHALLRLGFPVHQVGVKQEHVPIADCRALALAGSANSLTLILEIAARLPLAACALFIVQHVGEDQPPLLEKLVRERTAYRVRSPHHLEPVELGTIYIAPCAHHLKVMQGKIHLTEDAKVQYARPSIDILFESLALEYGEKVLAILSCGYGKDGVAGCVALERAGACVLVQSPEECGDATPMPDAAKDARAFRQVLHRSSIVSVAAAVMSGQQAGPSGELLEMFLEALWQQYSYDFRSYQRASLERRLRVLMNQFGLPGFCDFQLAIFSDPLLFDRMVAEISVRVTSFFRHPEQFHTLRTEVLPYLASFPVLKLWSAGCATGEEAYSLAILLEELGLLDKSRLFATDSNSYLLEIAHSGLYPSDVLDESAKNYRSSGGAKSFDSYVEPGNLYLTMQERMRQNTIFYHHSLVDSGVFNEFQLIVCRNVLIYFDSELQNKVLDCFVRSLHREGFLVLGPQDGVAILAREHGFVPISKGASIYRLGEGATYGG